MAERDKQTEARSATTGAAVEEASSTTRSGRPRGVDGESAGQSTTTQQRSGTGTAVAGRQDISAVLPTSRWELMRRLTEDLTGLFDSFGGGASTVPARRTGILTWIPRIEVQQQNNALIVRADLPGMGADNVEVTVENGMLVISGERRQQQQEERDSTVRTELVYGRFYRAIPLPQGADESAVTAIFRSGTLEITVPVLERDRGRRVEVQGQESRP